MKNLNSLTLSFNDTDLERRWSMLSINDNKLALTCLVVFQLLNDAVYDYSDYIRNPNLPIAD